MCKLIYCRLGLQPQQKPAPRHSLGVRASALLPSAAMHRPRRHAASASHGCRAKPFWTPRPPASRCASASAALPLDKSSRASTSRRLRASGSSQSATDGSAAATLSAGHPGVRPKLFSGGCGASTTGVHGSLTRAGARSRVSSLMLSAVAAALGACAGLVLAAAGLHWPVLPWLLGSRCSDTRPSQAPPMLLTGACGYAVPRLRWSVA